MQQAIDILITMPFLLYTGNMTMSLIHVKYHICEMTSWLTQGSPTLEEAGKNPSAVILSFLEYLLRHTLCYASKKVMIFAGKET